MPAPTPAQQPVAVGFGSGMRQDVHRSMLPEGAVYRATNVRRRAAGALGVRTVFAPAGSALTPQSQAWAAQLSGAPHAIGERSGNQALAGGGVVWERQAEAASAVAWAETGRVALARPAASYVIDALDAAGASFGGEGPISHQGVAAVGGTVCRCFSTGSTSGAALAVFEIAAEDGRVFDRVIVATGSNGGRVFPRVVGLAGAGTAGQFIFLYVDGLTVFSRTYDIASSAVTSGPTNVGTTNAVTDGFDAIPRSATTYLLANKIAALQCKVSELSNVGASVHTITVATSAGYQNESIALAASTAGVYLAGLGAVGGLYVQLLTPTLSGVTVAETLVVAATGTETRPALCPMTGGSAYLALHDVTTPSGINTHRIRTFIVRTTLVLTAIQTIYNCYPVSLPECPTANEARIWVTFIDASVGGVTMSRTDGRRSALLSLGIASDWRIVELWGEGRPVSYINTPSNLHKPAVAHGTQFDWFADLLSLRTDSGVASAGETTALGLFAYEIAGASAAPSTSRQLIEAGGALNVCGGGAITEAWGELGTNGATRQGIDNGMPTPTMLSAGPVAGAGMGTGLYQYCAVYEYLDSTGRRHRSAPSNIFAATTTAGNNQVRVRATTLGVGDRLTWRSGSLAVHVYRTQLAGSTFYRITSNATAPAANNGASLIDLTDAAPDASIVNNEILYTQGGVIANQPAPAHRYACFGDDRLWVAGTWNPLGVECSRLIVPGEPVQFTRHEAFRAYLPEPVTAVAYMDGSCVAFSKRGVFLIPGSGPNDEGSPALAPASRLPSDVGCIDQRSVVEVPQGLLFQSARGIFLLPRGFGAPQLVSGPVQDELAGQTVIGAARVNYDATAALASRTVDIGARHFAFLLGSSWLILDEESLQWVSVDSEAAGPYAVAGTWGGHLALAAATLSTYAAGASLIVEQETFGLVAASVETGDIAPFGVFGKGLIRGVQLAAELRGDTSVTLGVFYDGQSPTQAPATVPELHAITLPLPAGAAGIRDRVLFPTRRQACNAIRLLLSWQPPSGSGPASLMLGLGLDAEAQIGLADVAPPRRAP